MQPVRDYLPLYQFNQIDMTGPTQTNHPLNAAKDPTIRALLEYAPKGKNLLVNASWEYWVNNNGNRNSESTPVPSHHKI